MEKNVGNKIVTSRTGSAIKKSLVLLLAITACISCTKKQKQEAQRPNILFAIADDATYKHFGAYGTAWVKTPNFDKVAQQGILFMNAYTPNAKCAPSRASIITGRNSWQLEGAANHWAYFPKKFKTYPEVLNENGYSTGYTGKPWAPGIPGTVDGDERRPHDRGYPFRGIVTDNYLYLHNFKTDRWPAGRQPRDRLSELRRKSNENLDSRSSK